MQYTGWKNDFQKVQNSGKQALKSLYLAKEKLNIVENQKLSGLLEKISVQKRRNHFRMESTSVSLTNARHDMESFQMVLQDAEISEDLQADIHCFLSYADFFFYEFTEGNLKPAQIEDARLQVEDAIERVEYILSQMERNRLEMKWET